MYTELPHLNISSKEDVVRTFGVMEKVRRKSEINPPKLLQVNMTAQFP